LGYSFVITQISQHPERFNTFETNSEKKPSVLTPSLKNSRSAGIKKSIKFPTEKFKVCSCSKNCHKEEHQHKFTANVKKCQTGGNVLDL